MELLILITAAVLVLSFLSSFVEAALFSTSEHAVAKLADKGSRKAKTLLKIKQDIHRSISAIVILNNISNIGGAFLIGLLSQRVFDSIGIGIFSGVLTFMIILFAEITPKTIGERHALKVSLFFARTVLNLTILLQPLIYVIDFILRPLTKGETIQPEITEDDITFLTRLGKLRGNIDEHELRLISRIFSLNDTTASQIMTPRTVVFAFQAEILIKDALEQVRDKPYSRIPLYQDDMDDIIGVVHLRDILFASIEGKGETPIRSLQKEILFVPETVKAADLLTLFQKDREHLAVVVDEYGGTAGVVSLEDVLEVVVGEIVDKFDRDVDLRVKARTQSEMKNLRKEE
ncbi:MAG: HlyC/CorC family transporter [Chlorobi bacterium]|nr:HlyC/CorC family transporter [Chlorobiota bacterium]